MTQPLAFLGWRSRKNLLSIIPILTTRFILSLCKLGHDPEEAEAEYPTFVTVAFASSETSAENSDVEETAGDIDLDGHTTEMCDHQGRSYA